MRFTFLFIIGLILVSGFIAYFGDLLGRRMGKKRLALFRLRPRYTAIVVTTITGMLISALALATLISVNSQFKKVFTQGELIIKQNETLTQSNASLESQIRILKRQRRDLAEDVKKRKKEVASARRDATQATRARDVALKAVANLEKDILARQQELVQLKRKGALTEAQLKSKEAELRSVQQKMKLAQQDLTEAQKSLSAANEKLTTTQDRLEDARAQLVEKETQVQEKQKQIAEKQEQLNRANADYTVTAFYADNLAGRNLTYRKGDEIVRGIISPAQLNNGIESDLAVLLNKASDKASDRKAGIGRNRRYVNLVYINPNSRQIVLDERECIEKAAEAISKSFDDVLVQVVCATNTAEGMQAPVEFRLYQNKLVYKKGQKIASTVIDGNSKDVNILFSLIDFLQQDVARTALDAGLVPIPNPDPRATQGPNPRQQFEELMSVLDQIKEDNAPVYVDVYASQDVYSKDQLNMSNMNFTISKDKPAD